MAPEDLELFLNTHPFAMGLAPAYIALIARCARIRNAQPGEYLWRQGDRNVEAYLLLEGEVALEITVPHEGKLAFESIHAGDIAGCTAMLHNARWGFDGRATTPVRAVALNSRALRFAIESDTEFGYHILQRCTKSMVKRLDANRLRLVEAHSAVLP